MSTSPGASSEGNNTTGTSRRSPVTRNATSPQSHRLDTSSSENTAKTLLARLSAQGNLLFDEFYAEISSLGLSYKAIQERFFNVREHQGIASRNEEALNDPSNPANSLGQPDGLVHLLEKHFEALVNSSGDPESLERLFPDDGKTRFLSQQPGRPTSLFTAFATIANRMVKPWFLFVSPTASHEFLFELPIRLDAACANGMTFILGCSLDQALVDLPLVKASLETMEELGADPHAAFNAIPDRGATNHKKFAILGDGDSGEVVIAIMTGNGGSAGQNLAAHWTSTDEDCAEAPGSCEYATLTHFDYRSKTSEVHKWIAQISQDFVDDRQVEALVPFTQTLYETHLEKGSAADYFDEDDFLRELEERHSRGADTVNRTKIETRGGRTKGMRLRNKKRMSILTARLARSPEIELASKNPTIEPLADAVSRATESERERAVEVREILEKKYGSSRSSADPTAQAVRDRKRELEREFSESSQRKPQSSKKRKVIPQLPRKRFAPRPPRKDTTTGKRRRGPPNLPSDIDAQVLQEVDNKEPAPRSWFEVVQHLPCTATQARDRFWQLRPHAEPFRRFADLCHPFKSRRVRAKAGSRRSDDDDSESSEEPGDDDEDTDGDEGQVRAEERKRKHSDWDWTEEEHSSLVDAIALHGTDSWERIREELPDTIKARGTPALKSRYIRFIQPFAAVNQTSWTLEEDLLLFDLRQLPTPVTYRDIGSRLPVPRNVKAVEKRFNWVHKGKSRSDIIAHHQARSAKKKGPPKATSIRSKVKASKSSIPASSRSTRRQRALAAYSSSDSDASSETPESRETRMDLDDSETEAPLPAFPSPQDLRGPQLPLPPPPPTPASSTDVSSAGFLPSQSARSQVLDGGGNVGFEDTGMGFSPSGLGNGAGRDETDATRRGPEEQPFGIDRQEGAAFGEVQEDLGGFDADFGGFDPGFGGEEDATPEDNGSSERHEREEHLDDHYPPGLHDGSVGHLSPPGLAYALGGRSRSPPRSPHGDRPPPRSHDRYASRRHSRSRSPPRFSISSYRESEDGVCRDEAHATTRGSGGQPFAIGSERQGGFARGEVQEDLGGFDRGIGGFDYGLGECENAAPGDSGPSNRHGRRAELPSQEVAYARRVVPDSQIVAPCHSFSTPSDQPSLSTSTSRSIPANPRRNVFDDQSREGREISNGNRFRVQVGERDLAHSSGSPFAGTSGWSNRDDRHPPDTLIGPVRSHTPLQLVRAPRGRSRSPSRDGFVSQCRSRSPAPPSDPRQGHSSLPPRPAHLPARPTGSHSVSIAHSYQSLPPDVQAARSGHPSVFSSRMLPTTSFHRQDRLCDFRHDTWFVDTAFDSVDRLLERIDHNGAGPISVVIARELSSEQFRDFCRNVASSLPHVAKLATGKGVCQAISVRLQSAAEFADLLSEFLHVFATHFLSLAADGFAHRLIQNLIATLPSPFVPKLQHFDMSSLFNSASGLKVAESLLASRLLPEQQINQIYETVLPNLLPNSLDETISPVIQGLLKVGDQAICHEICQRLLRDPESFNRLVRSECGSYVIDSGVYHVPNSLREEFMARVQAALAAAAGTRDLRQFTALSIYTSSVNLMVSITPHT